MFWSVIVSFECFRFEDVPFIVEIFDECEKFKLYYYCRVLSLFFSLFAYQNTFSLLFFV
jgi:hypothetical protein